MFYGIWSRFSCFIIYTPRPPLPPHFDKNRAPTSFKTPPSPRRLFDVQDSLDKLMHFLPQLSVFFPLRSGLYSFRVQTA